jgi:hypothetical protein
MRSAVATTEKSGCTLCNSMLRVETHSGMFRYVCTPLTHIRHDGQSVFALGTSRKLTLHPHECCRAETTAGLSSRCTSYGLDEEQSIKEMT